MATKTSPNKSARNGGRDVQDKSAEGAITVVQTRVRRSDKALWVKAANRAKKLGLIQADGRGALSPWLLSILNAAAAHPYTNGNAGSAAAHSR